VSDASPQKGWDSWFGQEPGSSGDEQQAPEQAAPPAPAVSAQETRVVAPRRESAGASAGLPALAAAPKPELESRAEPVPGEVPPAPPESPAEQTNWTVPSLGTVLEGGDPQATQVAPPPAAASAVPPPRYSGQGRRAGQEQGQTAQGQTAQGETPQGLSAQGLSALGQTTQGQTAQGRTAQRQADGRDASTDGQDEPDQAATQWAPPRLGQPSAQPSGQDPDQAATQWAPPRLGQQTQNPDQVPTQFAPQGLGQQAQSPDQVPTHYAPQGLGQYPSPEETAAPQSPAGAPAAPARQAPQPAQMWSAAPAAPAYGQQQTQPPSHQQPQQHPQPGAGQQPPYGPGEEAWSDWDEPQQRRRSSEPEPEPDHDRDYDRDRDHAGSEDRSGGRGSRKKLAVFSGVGAAGIIALAAVLILNQGGAGGSGAAARPSGFQPTATSVAGDAQETAAAFLSAWESGNFQQAANYTDNPSAAMSMLTTYRDGLNLAGLQLTAQNATADPTPTASTGSTGTSTASPAITASGSVSFGVAAKVGLPADGAAGSTASSSASASNASTGSTGSSGSAAGAASDVTASWSYTSKLTAYKKNGGWWIKWDPALVAPNLTAGEKVVSIAVPPTASKVTDASGNDLADATDPGVRNIAAALKKSAPAGQGTPGVKIELEDASGKTIPNTADVLQQPVDTGAVKTTIDPDVESAAQSAVQKYKDSSMVVIKPSTGEILAVANNDGQNDFALTARVAPGSTNKIITSTALLANNLVSSPSQAVACPKTITVNGTVFGNSEGESLPASTPFLDDFAVSCNNAFGQWYDKIGSTTLAQTAQKYYGLNEQWDIGLGPAGPYYTIPSSASNGELFQELFGQGQLEAAPLAMASVAATVDNGTFKQPIVVPGAAQVSATPLPSSVQQNLKQMMKAVVTQSDGTAYNVFNGISSQVYGKTGTADVGTGGTKQQNPNSWMVVFDPSMDLAIGCVVLNAGYGASFAGPETAAVLKALQ